MNGFHVERRRIRDERVAVAQLGAPPEVGVVKHSRTYRTAKEALREAGAWNETGDWAADVLPGPAPRTPKRKDTPR